MGSSSKKNNARSRWKGGKKKMTKLQLLNLVKGRASKKKKEAGEDPSADNLGRAMKTDMDKPPQNDNQMEEDPPGKIEAGDAGGYPGSGDVDVVEQYEWEMRRDPDAWMGGVEGDDPAPVVTIPLTGATAAAPSCFVCCAPATAKTKWNSDPKFWRPKAMPGLYSFFLKELLEIPGGLARSFLGVLGRPQNWIKLCSHCQLLIASAADAKEKLTKLEAQLKECKQKVLKKVKQTVGFPRAVVMDKSESEDGLPKECRVLFKIHNFVANREYGTGGPGVGRTSAPAPPGNKVKVNKFPGPSQRSSVKLALNASRSRAQSKAKMPRQTPILPEKDFENEGSFSEPDDFPSSPVGVASDQEDPLATDNEPDVIEVEPEEGESRIIAPSRTYCGLCDDNRVYTSEAELVMHTNECHLQPPHPSRDPLPQSPSSSPGDGDDITITSDQEDQSKEIDNVPETTGKAPKSSSKAAFKPSTYRHYRYDCPNCPQIKKYSVLQYAQHLGIHLRRPYQCTKCLEFFPDIDDQHWKEKHEDGNLPSGEAATTAKFVKIKFDPGPIWKCKKCLTGFHTERDRTLHELRCNRVLPGPQPSSDPRPCQPCQKTFRSYPDWRLHRAIHHSEVDRMSCYICDESFCETTVEGVEARHDSKLQKHMFSQHHYHSRRLGILLECPPCGLVFDQLAEHMAHFQEKHGISSKQANRCDICQVTFCDAFFLRKHQTLRHFQSEASICDLCGSKCLHNKELAHHKLVTHAVEPEPGFKIFACPHEGCGYRAVDPIKYNGHRRHHVIKVSYEECKICGKSLRKGHLRDHMQIHLNKGTKPYQCEICGNSFAIKNYLYIHKRLSHEGRTFPSTNKRRTPKEGVRAGPSKKKKGSEAATAEPSEQEPVTTQDNPPKSISEVPK